MRLYAVLVSGQLVWMPGPVVPRKRYVVAPIFGTSSLVRPCTPRPRKRAAQKHCHAGRTPVGHTAPTRREQNLRAQRVARGNTTADYTACDASHPAQLVATLDGREPPRENNLRRQIAGEDGPALHAAMSRRHCGNLDRYVS